MVSLASSRILIKGGKQFIFFDSVVSVYIWASFYCFGIYLGFILLFRYIFGLHSVVSVFIWASFYCFGIIWASFCCFGI